MITFLIVLAEVCFWLFILAGLVARYFFKKEKLSLWLFAATPLIDLMLLTAAAVDLKSGETAALIHAVAAIYIGVSIAYGKRMIASADTKFQYYFLKIDNRPAKLTGVERGKKEMRGFFRNLTAYLISGAIILAMDYFLAGAASTENLLSPLRVWSVLLAIDFLISCSYVLFPTKKAEHKKSAVKSQQP